MDSSGRYLRETGPTLACDGTGRPARPAAVKEEELPLLIQDFSCANTFEEHVRLIEKYVASLFDTEPLLQSFLVLPSQAASLSQEPLRGSGNRDDTAPRSSADCSSSPATASSSSFVSFLDEGGNTKAESSSRVFSGTMTLYANPSPTGEEAHRLDLDLSIAVEVHVRDAAHPIMQQYSTPLFFLIRKIGVAASYRESESSYLLSLLATAVRQVLQQQKSGAVLCVQGVPDRRDSPAQQPVSLLSIPAPSREEADALPSPFIFPDGCAPCFAAVGDPYKQIYMGIAPPLPVSTLLPSSAASLGISAAEWRLLHHRTFTTRFFADAFSRPPENCCTLAHFLDLFQLHIGQHSRIRSDDFEGICVSLYKVYALAIPWKFYPHGPSQLPAPKTRKPVLSRSARAAAATGVEEEEVAQPLTWEVVLERENEHTALLAGSCTHAFGTPAPPVKHILFHFQWNQLQDVEAHEPMGRVSHLDPFYFVVPPVAPTAGTTALASKSAVRAAAQAAQWKCCITAQAILRAETEMEGGVSQRLSDLLFQCYLDSDVSSPAASPLASRRGGVVSSRTGRRVTEADASVNGISPSPAEAGTGRCPSPRARPHAAAGAANSGTASGGGGVPVLEPELADGWREEELQEWAEDIVGGFGPSVNVQVSLLHRFGTSHGSNDDGGSAEGMEGEGREGRTVAGVRAATDRRSSTALTQRLRRLWGTWASHQQLFSAAEKPEDAHAQRELTIEAAVQEAAGVKKRMDARRPSTFAGIAAAVEAGDVADIRLLYFPESFFSRFAHVSACDLPQPDEVRTLWRCCVQELRQLLIPVEADVTEAQRRAGWQRLLETLALPRADPPVDLGWPLLCQKLQLLRYAVYSLLHPEEILMTPVVPQSTETASPTAATEEKVGSGRRHLITNGEAVVVPPLLPSPPTTADDILKRARELNTSGAAAVVATASPAWLRGDGLYNDMCLFLYMNGAHEGHVVRFPDFVQWHSPRDFDLPPSPSSEDNDYLSDRMQRSAEAGRGSVHVWWSLWSRAKPRSPDEILRTLFNPLQQATDVIGWLANVPERMLVLEVGNAAISSALHQLLCHRFLLGDHGTGLRKEAFSAGGGGIPPSPRLPSLHRYAKERCAGITKDLVAASAMLSSSRDGVVEGGDVSRSPTSSVMEAMEGEVLRGLVANALRQLGEIEVSLCAAVTIHYLLGFSPDVDAATTVRALCSPAAEDTSTPGLRTRTVTVSQPTWVHVFARQFLRPESRAVRESRARLTCMAERPLDTGSCFQQLVVHHDSTNVLRLALALTKEVL